MDIADDVLQAARERAQREGKSMGELVSELARRGLSTPQSGQVVREPQGKYGLRPFPSRGGIVTNEMVDKLRDEDAY